MNSVWGTVCDTDFSSHDAHVACNQRGYDDQGIFSINFFLQSSFSIFLSF